MNGQLGHVDVAVASEVVESVARLYEEAFPECERIPLPGLLNWARADGVDFWAHLTDGVFCGLTFAVGLESYTYLLYLAVESTFRSKGLGTYLVGEVRTAHPGKPVVLEIEPVELGAANYDQRVRRASFYRRLGFSETGYDLMEEGERYTVLCDAPDFDAARFAHDLRVAASGYEFELLPSSRTFGVSG